MWIHKRQFIPPRTIIYWFAVILLGLAFFAFFRLSFLFRHMHLAPGIPPGDILESFLLGLKFDMSVISCLVFPFFIMSLLPRIGFEYSRVTRGVLQIILYIGFSLLFLLSLIDIEYYKEFGDHLGIWFYSYLDRFSLVWYGISGGFPWVTYLLAWLALTAIFVFAAMRFNAVFKSASRAGLAARVIYPLLGLALLSLALRGGTSLAPLDWGSAYHSNYTFANDLSLNGVFTLARSLYENYDDTEKNDPSRFRFMSSDRALREVQDALSQPGDSLVDPGHSLARFTPFDSSHARDYNVVIIILESWSAKFVGALGGSPDATPFFDSLAEKSLLFDNFFASGLRTNRGLLSVLCSFPSLPGRTVMKRYGSPHPFSSIAKLLGERGYETHFIYGGDLGFENMEGFFRGQRFDKFIGVDDFRTEDILNKWGVPDHIVFERANETFANIPGKPFLGVVVTLTNHEPFKVPGKQFEVFPDGVEHHDYLNTFHYSDWSLAHFFHLAEKEDYFKNTIFVLVGDHGKVLERPDDMVHNFRIASLIYCPGRPDILPRRISKICGQVDLLPTILGLLGRPEVHESWGRDILADGSGGGFAFLNKNDGYVWIQDSLMLCESPDTPPRLYRFPDDSLCISDISVAFSDSHRKMQTRGEAMMQLEVELVHIKPPDRAAF